MDIKKLEKIKGMKVIAIKKADADEGFILTFEDGSQLKVGYNGGEGWTKLNDTKLDED